MSLRAMMSAQAIMHQQRQLRTTHMCTQEVLQTGAAIEQGQEWQSRQVPSVGIQSPDLLLDNWNPTQRTDTMTEELCTGTSVQHIQEHGTTPTMKSQP